MENFAVFGTYVSLTLSVVYTKLKAFCNFICYMWQHYQEVIDKHKSSNIGCLISVQIILIDILTQVQEGSFLDMLPYTQLCFACKHIKHTYCSAHTFVSSSEVETQKCHSLPSRLSKQPW